MSSRSKEKGSSRKDNWEPAGFWVRAFAALLDLALLCGLAYAALYAASSSGIDIEGFVSSLRQIRSTEKLMKAVTVSNTLLAFAPVLAYMFWHALWECSPFSGSPGKAAFGIKATDYSRESIIFSQALKRNFYKNIPFFILLVGTVAALSLAVAVPVIIPSMRLILIGLGAVSAVVLVLGHASAGMTNDCQALHDSLSDSLVLKNIEVSFLRRAALVLLTAGIVWLAIKLEKQSDSPKEEQPSTTESFTNPFKSIGQWFQRPSSDSENEQTESQTDEQPKSGRRIYRERGTSNPLSKSKWRYIRPDDAQQEGVGDKAKWWYSDDSKESQE